VLPKREHSRRGSCDSPGFTFMLVNNQRQQQLSELVMLRVSTGPFLRFLTTSFHGSRFLDFFFLAQIMTDNGPLSHSLVESPSIGDQGS
jgi:hypothetical protein